MIGLTIYDINTKRHYHTFRDLDLILNSKEIGEPKPKIYEAEVDGANGKIDLTEFSVRSNSVTAQSKSI